MSERMEETPSFRLGMACTQIRILLGEFGAPQAADVERARAFLKSEDELIHRVLYPETC